MVDVLQLQGILFTVAVVLGVLGNFPVIVSIFQQRSLLKSSYYYLILHLAICDFLSLLFIIPDIYSIFSVSPPITSWSYPLCKVYRALHTIAFTAGANFLVLISALRYRAIVHPFKAPVRRRNLKLMSSVVYVWSIISMIPYVLVLRYDENMGFCYEEWPAQSYNIAYTISLTFVQYFIPVGCVSVMYFKIGKELLTRNEVFNSLDARNQSRQPSIRNNMRQHYKIRDLKPLLVSFVIVACFTISGLPSQALWIAFVASPENPTASNPDNVHFCHALYVFGTYVINPFVYGALDKKVFSLFKKCRKKTTAGTSASP